MREKQVLPVVVVGLTAALVAVITLWTLDRVEGPASAAASQDGPVEVSFSEGSKWLVLQYANLTIL